MEATVPRANVDRDTFETLLSTVRAFARERLIPIEAQVDAEDAVPKEIIGEMRALGLYGITIPQEYGGLGLGVEDSVRMFFELCYAAPVFRSLVGINNGLGSWSILSMGTDKQRATYLPGLASGEMVASFCLTEPESGSDAGAMTTTATRDG